MNGSVFSRRSSTTGRLPRPGRETSLIAESSGVQDVRVVLEAGASANERHPLFGLRPLAWAAMDGDVEFARVLLDAGADLTATSSSPECCSTRAPT